MVGSRKRIQTCSKPHSTVYCVGILSIQTQFDEAKNGRNGIEHDFENCRITVLAAGACIVQLRYFLVQGSDRYPGCTMQLYSDSLNFQFEKLKLGKILSPRYLIYFPKNYIFQDFFYQSFETHRHIFLKQKHGKVPPTRIYLKGTTLLGDEIESQI